MSENTFSNVVGAISNVGFPIVACLLMGALCYWIIKSHKEEIKALSTAIEDVKTVLQNNTAAINMLKDKIK